MTAGSFLHGAGARAIPALRRSPSGLEALRILPVRGVAGAKIFAVLYIRREEVRRIRFGRKKSKRRYFFG